jgi:NTP pyrophosphatase (non-canonical NTP hydrolase)
MNPMDFDYYQEIASGTDQNAGQNAKKDEGLMIPLLGIAGETGTLLAEFKKKIRDEDSYEGFQEKAEEELGDILWYLSNIATRMGLSLSEIASKIFKKQASAGRQRAIRQRCSCFLTRDIHLRNSFLDCSKFMSLKAEKTNALT